jgi:prepilin-type N-terminal cleavage/methylation domain-containing protein
MKRHQSSAPGVTLVELIVVLAVIGLTFGIVGVALRSERANPRELDASVSVREQLARARREALRSGMRQIVIVRDNGNSYSATAWPDGRIVAESTLDVLAGIDRLSGRTANARTNVVGVR